MTNANNAPRVVLSLVVAGLLMSLLAALVVALKSNPTNSTDLLVMEEVTSWDLHGLTGFMEEISFLSGNYPGMALGLAGIAFLWLVGLTRQAAAFAGVGATVGITAFLGDVTLGEIVAHARPLDEASSPSSEAAHHVIHYITLTTGDQRDKGDEILALVQDGRPHDAQHEMEPLLGGPSEEHPVEGEHAHETREGEHGR